MRTLFLYTFVILLIWSPIARPNPGASLLRCTLPGDPVQRQTAERLMQLALPYLDQQIVYYRDQDARITGYAIRRSLRIYFYSAGDSLRGTAVRRTEARTSYFDAHDDYLGQCVNHKMELPGEQRLVNYDSVMWPQ
jgi:hypothetical protein